MRRAAGLSLVVALLVMLAALPALAWSGEGYGDCDGWHVTNPEADWNSSEWEMVIFPLGMIVPYGETVFVAPQLPDETERRLWLAWRKVDDGDNYKHQDKLELTRDLTECTPATTTTEAPPSTTTTTEPSPSTTLTTAPSTTTPPTSSSTTTTAPTTSTTSPAPTSTADTTPPTDPPADPPTADTLPRTGIGSAASLVGVAGLSGLVGLLLIGRKGDE